MAAAQVMASTTYSLDGLKDRLLEHQRCFDTLLNLIPSKYYLNEEEDSEMNNKYMHKKKKKLTEEDKESMRKAKKRKLDPEASKSVSEIQADSVQQQQSSSTASSPQDSPATSDIANEKPAIKPMQNLSISELQKRLHARIEALRSKRKVGPSAALSDAGDGDDTAESQPPRSRQEILERRLKRKQDREKKKQSNKANKASKAAAVEIKKGKQGDVEGALDKSSRSALTVEENVSFGKLDFEEVEGGNKKKRKADTVGLLKKAEAKKAKLEKLKESQPEKASQIEDSLKWSKALKQASGEKIKDDPKLLKKTLKRKQKIKERSKKDWDKRKETVRQNLEEKQKKRQENIQARAEAKKAGKAFQKPKGGSPKGKGGKGKGRPGFEGSFGKKKK
ncbi:hypothetical protein HK102_008603 [Quaeritorhiza haematococci]|nr:hypothetical protein HK102_008603 [Quaeritorhiza haematococci]